MRKSLVVAALVASTLVLASCAMPADDPNFDANGGNQDSAAASAEAAGQAAMEAALAAPTSIGVDAPLTAAPAKGSTIISLTDGSAYEGVFETALGEAATVLGWTVQSVTADPADAAAVATAFDDAVAAKPAGIHITGAYVDGLADSLPKAQAAGIPVVCTGCSGGPEATAAATDASAPAESASAAPVESASAAPEESAEAELAPVEGITDASINGTAQNTEWADVLASYVVSYTSADANANVQVFTVPGSGGAIADFNTEFGTSLNTQCHNCGTTESTFDPTTTDMADPSAVSAFVASEMETAQGDWALLDSGAQSDGVAEALANDFILLTPVALIGRGASATDIANLQAAGGAAPAASAEASASAGEPSPSAVAESDVASAEATSEATSETDGEAAVGTSRTLEQAAAMQAWIAIPQPVMAWRVIDQFARILGQQDLATGPLPSQLVTTANAADAVVDGNGDFVGIADYQDQFKALWGVS